MAFWLAVLTGGLLAWGAVQVGFYAAWMLFFNLLLAVYMAVFLGPTLISGIPAATEMPYGYALTLAAAAVITFAISYGLCFACLSGRLYVQFPKALDNVGAGVLGFFTGFLLWSFLAFVVSVSPLAESGFCKTLGLNASSQAANRSYVCWWCNRLHTLVSARRDKTTAQESVAQWMGKAIPSATDQPASAPALAAETPHESAAPPSPPAALPPSPPKPPSMETVVARTETPPAAPAEENPPPPPALQTASSSRVPSLDPPEARKEEPATELSRRKALVDDSESVTAAVADPDVLVIEIEAGATADKFSPEAVRLLREWVSNGGVLWTASGLLRWFGVECWPLDCSGPIDCVPASISHAAAADCQRVTLKDAKDKAVILPSPEVVPLLKLAPGDRPGYVAGMAVWSLAPYGRGWVSDCKQADLSQYDGARFWRNFCEFCLNQPSRNAAANDATHGELSGEWQAAGGARFRIDDHGKTADVQLIQSDALRMLAGKLRRAGDDPKAKSLAGVVYVAFSNDPVGQYPVRVAATAEGADQLRLRCADWPVWNNDGKFLGARTLREVWVRADSIRTPSPNRALDPIVIPRF